MTYRRFRYRTASLYRPPNIPGVLDAFFWYGSFLLALFLETSVFPRIFGYAPPAVALAASVTGMASLGFMPGFFFTAFAGLVRDIITGGGINTITLFGTFLLIHIFRAASQWEEPMGRIGALAAGMIFQPFLWLAAVPVALWFGGRAPEFTAGGIMSAYAGREIIFIFLWFLFFAWWSVYRVRRERGRRLIRV